MSSFSLFGLFSGSSNSAPLPDLFPFSCVEDLFVKTDIISTYQKILNDVIERTHGLPEKYNTALYDNCIASEASKGLISFLSESMFDKTELFLVYKNEVLREATAEEKKTIVADYKKAAKSSTGVYISFKNYKRSDVLKIYSALEYYCTAALHKSVNISKTVQIKISDLRSSTNVLDASKAESQMQAIADALKNGKSIGIDAKDSIETAQVDTAPVEKAISFIDSKRAYILGLPVAYVSGVLTPGIGSTGEADMREIERGLKQYFVTIIEPVIFALFNVRVTFKSQDFRSLTSALDALRTFDMTSDSFLPTEQKIEIVAQLFDIDPTKLKAAVEKQAKEDAKKKPVTQGTPITATQPEAGADGVSKV